MSPHNVTPESEARWQAWLAKGRVRERRTRHRVGIFMVVLTCSAAVVAAFIFGM